jgi:hypothetical protein
MVDNNAICKISPKFKECTTAGNEKRKAFPNLRNISLENHCLSNEDYTFLINLTLNEGSKGTEEAKKEMTSLNFTKFIHIINLVENRVKKPPSTNSDNKDSKDKSQAYYSYSDYIQYIELNPNDFIDKAVNLLSDETSKHDECIEILSNAFERALSNDDTYQSTALLVCILCRASENKTMKSNENNPKGEWKLQLDKECFNALGNAIYKYDNIFTEIDITKYINDYILIHLKKENIKIQDITDTYFNGLVELNEKMKLKRTNSSPILENFNKHFLKWLKEMNSKINNLIKEFEEPKKPKTAIEASFLELCKKNQSLFNKFALLLSLIQQELIDRPQDISFLNTKLSETNDLNEIRSRVSSIFSSQIKQKQLIFPFRVLNKCNKILSTINDYIKSLSAGPEFKMRVGEFKITIVKMYISH